MTRQAELGNAGFIRLYKDCTVYNMDHRSSGEVVTPSCFVVTEY
jgi:hypothetical protein